MSENTLQALWIAWDKHPRQPNESIAEYQLRIRGLVDNEGKLRWYRVDHWKQYWKRLERTLIGSLVKALTRLTNELGTLL